MGRAVALPTLACCLAVTALSDPVVEFRVGPSGAFLPGSTIGVGPDAAGIVDLRLIGARAAVDLESIDISLNGTSIAGFARLSRMPRGVRVVVDRQNQNHPDLGLRARNLLAFACEDLLRNSYRAHFDLRVSPAETGARLLASPSTDTPRAPVERQSHAEAPKVSLRVPEVGRGQRTARIYAEIRDLKGIREVILEVNWKEFERIVMQNGLPSRRRGKFRSSRALPGSARGDSEYLLLEIPIPMQRRETRVSIRAENSAGAVASEVVHVRKER